MNGDNDAQLGEMLGAAVHSNGMVRLYAKTWGATNKEAKGPCRVNWVVIAP